MKKNIKGFTLVELLAVIVILAILMVSAGAGVMTTLNNAKVNTFKNEILTAVNGVENMYSEISMNPAAFNSYIKPNIDDKHIGTGNHTMAGLCVTLAGLVNNGYLKKDISTYAGVILMEIPYDGSAPKYMVWAHNSSYGINGVEKSQVNKLKYKRNNNTESRVSTMTITADDISGGKVGIVTNLKGIRKQVKLTYGVETVGNPTNLDDVEATIESDLNGGGTGNTYKKIKCINKKQS